MVLGLKKLGLSCHQIVKTGSGGKEVLLSPPKVSSLGKRSWFFFHFHFANLANSLPLNTKKAFCHDA